MTDTKSAAPSDAEIEALAAEHLKSFVLARWGAPQPVARVPLTDEQIKDEASYHGLIGSADQLVKFARAIEAAHGIGTEKGDNHGLPT